MTFYQRCDAFQYLFTLHTQMVHNVLSRQFVEHSFGCCKREGLTAHRERKKDVFQHSHDVGPPG